MPLSKVDLQVIRCCFLEKGWRGRRLCREFPDKQWKRSTVDNAIKKLETTGSIERKEGSGRPVTVTTEENKAIVEEMLLSQEGEEGTQGIHHKCHICVISCNHVYHVK